MGTLMSCLALFGIVALIPRLQLVAVAVTYITVANIHVYPHLGFGWIEPKSRPLIGIALIGAQCVCVFQADSYAAQRERKLLETAETSRQKKAITVCKTVVTITKTT